MSKEKFEEKTDRSNPAESVRAELVRDKKELTPEEKKKKYLHGLAKTFIAVILGSAAGGLCYLAFGAAANVAWFLLLAVVAIFAYYAQRRLIYPALKLSPPERGVEWIGNVLLVLLYCIVVWTIFLNIGVPVWTEPPAYDEATNEISFALDREAAVSYVVLDQEIGRRKDVSFENAAAVSLSPASSTDTNGKAVTIYKGSLTENISGKCLYIRAAVDSASMNGTYVKGTIFELSTIEKDPEPEKTSFFSRIFGTSA